MVAFYADVYFWIWNCIGLFILMIGMIILLLMLWKWTHAFTELVARLKGSPISLIFFDNKTVNWITEKPNAGMIQHKDYGSFIVNERGSYTDGKTRNVFMAFDGGFGSGASIKAFKLSSDLMAAIKDECKMAKIREALINGNISDEHIIVGLKESINFSHLRSLTNTLLPHNITSLIEKIVAQRMAGFGKVNWMAILIMMAGLIGATTICIILLKMYG
jgi:hypothetical protein